MKKCPNCNKNFTKNSKYCSKLCYSRAKAKRYYQKHIRNQTQECTFCHKLYHPTRKNQMFCSKECSAKAYTKFISIPKCLKDASRKIDKKIGYVRIYCPTHSKANTWGYVYEHRLIIETILGRKLDKTEHVHHINGKRWDNRPENLQLLSNSEHSKIKTKNNPKKW